jgi:hypothetical protein
MQLIMMDAWLPLPLHVNDFNIVEYFTSLNLTPLQLEGINRCHVYLQVISLSDIVSADGTKIVSPTLKGQQMLDRQSLLAWPAQHNPTNSDWDLWLSSLSSLCVGSTLIQHIILQPIQGHQTWFWYMDSHRTLFLNDDQTWRNIPPLTPLCELLGRMWAYIGPPLQRPAPHRLLPYRTPASNGKGILPRQYRVTTQLPYHPLHHRILLGRHPLQIAFPCRRDYTLSTSTSSFNQYRLCRITTMPICLL